MAIEILTPGNEDSINRHANWVADMEFERVLDVGGLEKPLRPATHVMDLYSYEERRVDEGRGDPPERFMAATWLVWDVNSIPWPWPDGFFNYVWCCQVAEDIRDPIAVCNEMQRVARAGFISTVHRSYESHVVQYDGVVGYHHHRWLVEASEEKNSLTFTWKSPILQTQAHMRAPAARDWLLNVAWRGQFKVGERFTGGDHGQYQELRSYLKREGWA